MDISIPANTIATVYLPAADEHAIKENGAALAAVNGLKVMGSDAGFTQLQLGSGTYHFEMTKPAVASK